MKKWMLLALASLSFSAFAQQSCKVAMFDVRNPARVYDTFRAYTDANGDCVEGMKECRKSIRLRGLLDKADCEVVTGTRPAPGPIPAPVPDPDIRGDHMKPLSLKERVVYNNAFHLVYGIGGRNYMLKSDDRWGTITKNVTRDMLAVTEGCNDYLCANDTVIQIKSFPAYATVAGLSFDGTFVIKPSNSSFLSSKVRADELAVTNGCIELGRRRELCTGDEVVYGVFNDRMKVVGIQNNGKVVLESEDRFKTLKKDIDPFDLVITR